MISLKNKEDDQAIDFFSGFSISKQINKFYNFMVNGYN